MAKISIKEKKTLYISFTPDPQEEQFPQCMWAIFVIDTDDMNLTIRSDGGNMSYTWQNIGDNTPNGFLKFLSNANLEYLLCKLSNRTKFNFEKTKETMLTFAGPAISLHLIKTQPFCNEQSFASWYMDLPGAHSDDLEAVVMDYPAGHRAAMEAFVKYVQPKLKEMLA